MQVFNQSETKLLKSLEQQFINNYKIKLSEQKSHNSNNKITIDKSLILYTVLSLIPLYPIIIFGMIKLIVE